jgi:IS5 family transposase
MKIFEDFKLRFEKPNWRLDPELGLIDTILETHPHLFTIVRDDIIGKEKSSKFGRNDTPSIEQIVRAAIYKELKGRDYRELAYDQEDSRICALFIKIDELRPYSHQVYQKYISRISSDSLDRLLVELNKIAINNGLEDLERLRQDSTTVESDIHYPTNNSLVWDCIKEAQRQLDILSREINTMNYRDYTRGAKKTYYKINVTKSKDKRTALFQKQLSTFAKSINQVSNIVKKKETYGDIKIRALLNNLESLLSVMKRVYDITYRKEIRGEQVPNEEKLFSIYEQHTDIIVKGNRNAVFGHKVNIATGKSNLVLSCDVVKGNPSDTELYAPTLDKVIQSYDRIPRDSVEDGGYASYNNLMHAKERGIINVVFNKIKGSFQNAVSSKHMETRLKKWRSGVEANISNIKRGFKLRRCYWKGWAHFKAKVLWSVICYNIRVMTGLMVQLI